MRDTLPFVRYRSRSEQILYKQVRRYASGIWCITGLVLGQERPEPRRSRQCSVPLFFQRPAAPPTRAKFELALADPMHEFQAREGHGRRPVRLEAEHGLAPTLDGPVVLLDDVVQIAALAHQDGFPPAAKRSISLNTIRAAAMAASSGLSRDNP